MWSFKIILLFIVHMIVCNNFHIQHDADNPMNRIGRAVPATTRPVKTPGKIPGKPPVKGPGKNATAAPVTSQKKSTIPEVVHRHMMLGRMFNALYLQNQLANNTIDYSDAIAGVWNLKDKTVIDKISSLNVNGLTESLTKLDAKIKADNNGTTRIADVGDLEEKMKSLDQITDEMRNNLLASTNSALLPEYTSTGVTDLESKMEQLKEDLALKALNFVKLVNISQNYADNAIAAGPLLSQCRTVLAALPDLISGVHAKPGSFDALLKGIDMADSLKSKNEDFTALSTLLRETGTALSHIKKLGDGVGLDKVRQTVGQLNTILLTFGQRSSVVPIGIAFLKDRNLSRIEADWQTEWMRALLHNGTTLRDLSNALPDFKDLAHKLQPITNNMTAWFEIGASDRMSHVSQLIEHIIKVSENTGLANLDNLASCLSVPTEEDYSILSEVRNVASSSKDFHQRVNQLETLLGNEADRNSAISTLADIKAKLDTIETMTEAQFKSYMNSSSGGKGQAELAEIVKDLSDLSTNWFSKLKGDDKFKDTVDVVLKGKVKVRNSLDILSKMSIAKPECNLLFSFKPAELGNLNDAPHLITLIKTQSDIFHLKPLVDSIPKVSAGLKQLKSPETPPPPSATRKPPTKPAVTKKPVAKPVPKKPKRETEDDDDEESPTEFETSNPKNLLDAAFSFRSLEVMEEIHKSDKVIETILKRGGEAKRRVESDPELKKKLEDVWKGFDNSKATLSFLQAAIKKSLSNISLTGDGSSFAEVQQVYASLSTSPIHTSPIQLQEYRKSLAEFPDSGAWKDLEDAFAKLERPVSTDFKLSYAAFSKMPQVLKSLEDELENFFTSQGSKDDWKKPGIDFIMIILIVVGILVIFSLAGSVAGVVYWCVVIRDPEMKEEFQDNDDYIPVEGIAWEQLTYMQLQDSRLDINRRDKNGNTPMFNAMARRDWDAVAKYVYVGAIKDAVCNGDLHRTMLFELVLMKEREWVKVFLEDNANIELHDYKGDDADSFSLWNGMEDLFSKYWEGRKERFLSRDLPAGPRPWKILVFDAKQFPRKLRKKLPLRVKKFTTWGYKKGMDLNEFTTIVVPYKYYSEYTNTINLDDDDLMTFRLYGCAATLINVMWFEWMIEKPQNVKHTMDEDYKYWFLHTCYKGQRFLNTITTLKTRIHRLQPPLLTDVRIYFLETKDKKVLAKRKEWIEIIELFGGSVVDKIVGDDWSEYVGPYWSMEYDYFEERSQRQNKCWILKFADTKTDKPWTKQVGRYTLAPFALLPESIARCELLGVKQKFVPIEEDEIQPPNGPNAKTNATSVSTTSTTNDAGKTPVTATGGNNNATTTAATSSVSGTTSTVGEAPSQSKMKNAERVRSRMMRVKGPNGRKMLSREDGNQVQVPTSIFGVSKEPARVPEEHYYKRQPRLSMKPSRETAEPLATRVAPEK